MIKQDKKIIFNYFNWCFHDFWYGMCINCGVFKTTKTEEDLLLNDNKIFPAILEIVKKDEWKDFLNYTHLNYQHSYGYNSYNHNRYILNNFFQLILSWRKSKIKKSMFSHYNTLKKGT